MQSLCNYKSFIGQGYRAWKMSPFWWPLQLWKKLSFSLVGWWLLSAPKHSCLTWHFQGRKSSAPRIAAVGCGVACPRKHFWALLLCRPCYSPAVWGPLPSFPQSLLTSHSGWLSRAGSSFWFLFSIYSLRLAELGYIQLITSCIHPFT